MRFHPTRLTFPIVFLIASLWAGCGGSGDDAGSTTESASSSSSTSSSKSASTTAEKPKAPASAAWYEKTDVVGLKLGVGEGEADRKLTADGWKQTTERRKIANVPGIEPIDYPENRNYERLVERDGGWDHEFLGLHFLAPLPGEEAPLYILMFDRKSLPSPTFRNRITEAKIVTTDYATSMLAATRTKYGEPARLDEGACTSRGGSVVESIPTYEIHYFMEARAYNGGGLQVKIGSACKQSFEIRMEDSTFARNTRNRFDSFAKAQLEKAATESTRPVDF